MISIALALASALGYGAADFLGGLASRRASIFGVVVVSQGAGLAALLMVLPWFGGWPSREAALGGMLAGAFGAAGIGLLYLGLAVGRMGVVSPITAGLAAAIPAIWGFAHGERTPLSTLIGLFAALAAVVLVSISPGEPGGVKIDRRFGVPAGVLEAVASGVFIGGFFIALAGMDKSTGMAPLAAARFSSIGLLVAAALLTRQPVTVPRIELRMVLLCGVLDMSANVLFLLAARSGLLAIVSVLSSLYPAATVALAAVRLHERLSRIQWTGVAFAFAGIILIAL